MPVDPKDLLNVPRPKHLRGSDLHGASRLAVDATLGLTRLVENLHQTILRGAAPLGAPTERPTGGITGLVYRSIRGVTRLVGGSLDALLGQLAALQRANDEPASPEREAVLAALNGVLGDYLDTSRNPLAITMHLRHGGRPLARGGTPPPDVRRRVLLMVHGLCMNPQQWQRNGHDHGAALAAEGGYTPLYLHYNSGLHISTNGRLLADQLQALLAEWPVPLDELVILGHSMGGLVARSACAQAQARGDGWPQQLSKMVFLGTPHHGAPLERGGHWIDLILGATPYTAAFARLGKVRSAGITDLRHGCLLDADWAGDPAAIRHGDHRTPVPLPAGVACHAVAGSLGVEPGALREKLLGDGLVPVASALGRHRVKARALAFEPGRTFIAQGVGHLGLLDSPAVFAQLRAWLLPLR